MFTISGRRYGTTSNPELVLDLITSVWSVLYLLMTYVGDSLL